MRTANSTSLGGSWSWLADIFSMSSDLVMMFFFGSVFLMRVDGWWSTDEVCLLIDFIEVLNLYKR
tara:strand:- start:634 stop:828 length:195 start_codon:yes stop_codon:yes gene_type:complete